jgi:hypothetical protein
VLGPVTLAQARALATVPAPLERGVKVAVAAASPAAVGFERRKLEAKQDLERRRRIKEYRATLAIMKTRGVKGLSAQPPEADAHSRRRPGRSRCSPR